MRLSQFSLWIHPQAALVKTECKVRVGTTGELFALRKRGGASASSGGVGLHSLHRFCPHNPLTCPSFPEQGRFIRLS